MRGPVVGEAAVRLPRVTAQGPSNGNGKGDV